MMMGVLFLFYTQFLLYERVNELYEEEGLVGPLQPWWSLPVFFPFNVIVGLRQVHFLSEYFYMKRGISPIPADPMADIFPFIKAEPFTWQEFLLRPRLWCSWLSSVDDIDRSSLPQALQTIFTTGEGNRVD